MLKIVTHSGEMRQFLIQRISQKPPIRDIHIDFLHRPAQRGDSVQMLNQHNLKQDDWVHAGTTVILAIQIFYKVINMAEIYRAVDLSQQMILRHQ